MAKDVSLVLPQPFCLRWAISQRTMPASNAWLGRMRTKALRARAVLRVVEAIPSPKPDTRILPVEFDRRLSVVTECRRVTLADAGHMLHHDQPAALARALADFLR